MPSLPKLDIRLKRHPDGSASITLTRADGTVTWQRQKGSLALVFPSHDLTHYAVEQTLGYRFAFYGLVADGWEISDFAMPWPRGPIPEEAREVEMVVGLFDGMRRDRDQSSAAELNVQLRQLAADSRFAGSLVPRTLTDDDLARVREVRSGLLARWGATASGSSLDLVFARQ
jgi:hypothetical protein